MDMTNWLDFEKILLFDLAGGNTLIIMILGIILLAVISSKLNMPSYVILTLILIYMILMGTLNNLYLVFPLMIIALLFTHTLHKIIKQN